MSDIDPAADRTDLVDNASEVDAPTAPTEDTHTDDPDTSEVAREARNWRKKYQATKADLEAAGTQISALQKQIVEHQLAGKIADPADWWTAVNLADLIGDDGAVDSAQITAKLADVLAAKPHWAARRPSPATPASEVTSTHTPTPAAEPPSWATLLGNEPTS